MPPGEMEALRKMVAEFSALRQEREERIEALERNRAGGCLFSGKALAERDAAWDAKCLRLIAPGVGVC